MLQAQFYIDDCGINALADLQKELGFYLPLKTPSKPSEYTSPPNGGGSAAAKKLAKKEQGHPELWSFVNMTVAFYAVAITGVVVFRSVLARH